MIEDPRGAARTPRARAISALAQRVTESPWTLDGGDLARARAAELDDGAILQTVMLSAFFGYLNRVADATGVELDYDVAVRPPPPDAATPPWPRPDADAFLDPGATAPGPIDLDLRAGAADALAAWSEHVMDRDGPLPRERRWHISRVAAATVGDASIPLPRPASDALDRALATFTETIALTPWRLGAPALAALSAAGLPDAAALFDAVAVAAFCNFSSRLSVALAALGRG